MCLWALRTLVDAHLLFFLRIGCLLGLALSSVLFGVLDGAVDAVLVCFAGSPAEFHRHHPALSYDLWHAWKEAWPGSLAVNAGPGLAALQFGTSLQMPLVPVNSALLV